MIAFFIKKHMAVFTISVLIVLMGVMAYLTLPRESSPEIKQPLIFVTTVYPGVSPKDMENLVTRRLEEEIDGLEGIKQITSSSQQSVSSIAVEFSSETAVETALRKVKERVDKAKATLPADSEDPQVRELNSSNWPIFIIVLSHPDGLTVIDSAAQQIEERIKRIPGVLDVQVTGNLHKELTIDVNPGKLEYYDLSLSDISSAIQSENVSIPGGLLKSTVKNYVLSVSGEITDPDIFREIIVDPGEKQIKLGELADVRFSWADPTTISRLNGSPAITISVTKRTGQNMINIVDTAKKNMAELKSSFPDETEITYSYDESKEIRSIISDLENNMFTAFILVLLVTIFFLGKTNSLFVSLAIPFSMLISFFVLQLFGITLNMIVLFSLILALGMLVDNGIVIVENIFRHASLGKSRIQATIDGAREVAGPIIASTVTTCLAFLPIIFMPGIMGEFMSYLPKTVIIVLASSLFVALVINPVFCAQFMRISPKAMKKIVQGSGLFIRFQNWYEQRLLAAVKRPGIVIALSFGIVILGFILYGYLGKEPIFFPHVDPSTLVISLEARPGTPLKNTDRLVGRIENQIPGIKASVDNYQITVGRSSGGFFSGMGDESNKASLRLEFAPYLERKISGEKAVENYKETLVDFTGANIEYETLDMAPPSGHSVSYQVVGRKYEVLGKISSQMVGILKKYPELKLVKSDYESTRPEIAVVINRQKAAYYGLSTREIAYTIRNAINGSVIGSFRKDENEYDILLRYQRSAGNSLSSLRNLQVVTHQGERIPVYAVAKVVEGGGSVGMIKRRNLKRAVGVWADFRPGVQNKEEVQRAVEKKFKEMELPDSYTIEPGEGFEIQSESSHFLIQAFLIALFLIMVVLIAQFNSLADPFIIIISVFLSIGGVLWGYLLSGQSFVVIMSGIGCIALAGVAVNNCIVLVDYTNVLLKGGKPWKEAVIEAGKTRLRPVLLTAITTVLGLVPMASGISFDFHKLAFQLGSEQSEFWKAFAWAMIYGLSFATVMTLVVVPSLLALKFKLKERFT